MEGGEGKGERKGRGRGGEGEKGEEEGKDPVDLLPRKNFLATPLNMPPNDTSTQLYLFRGQY